MNWYDLVVIAGLLYGVWSGLRAGLTGEIIRVIGLVLMIVLAVQFYVPAGHWLQAHSRLDENPSLLIAFVGIALAVYFVVLAARLATQREMLKLKFAALLENVGGGFAGIVRMAIIMIWVTVLLCLSDSDFWRHSVGRESQIGSFIIGRIPAVDAMVKRSFPEKTWLRDLKRRPEPNYEEAGPTNTKPSQTISP